MKVLALMGSPRKGGNTAALLAPFCEELCAGGAEVETVWLYERDIRPCLACRRCQEDWMVFGCGHGMTYSWFLTRYWTATASFWQHRFTPGTVRRP